MPAIAITDLPALGRAPEGADRVPVEGRTTTLGAIFDALGAGATQIVTESPAAVSARAVVLDDDGHTAETPGVLTLPPITEGARHTIWTPYDSVFYSVTPHPDDVGVSISGGSSYLINSQLMRSVAYDVIAVETSEGLTWLIDNGAARVINEGIYPTLIDHEARIEAAEGDIDALEARVSPTTGRISQATQSDPSAPAAGSMEIYAKLHAGREMPAFRGSAARPMLLQPFLGRAGIWHAMPGTAGGAATLMNCIAPTHETSSAGAQLTEGSAGSMRSQLRRYYVDGGTSTTSYAGYRGQNLSMWRGNAAGLGGFACSITMALGVAPATHALFVGLIGSTGAFAANDVPSNKTDCIFFGYDSGDATCQIMHNDGSGTCTKIPLTHAKLTTSDVIRVSFWCAPNSTTISYLIENLATGASETGTTGTSNLPTSTTFMTWHAHVNVATVSGQAFIEWFGSYGESGQ